MEKPAISKVARVTVNGRPVLSAHCLLFLTTFCGKLENGQQNCVGNCEYC